MASTINKIFKALDQENCRYVIVGGVATVLHGVDRLTADLDLVIELLPENIASALATFKQMGFKPMLPVPMEDFSDEAKRSQWIKNKGLEVFTLWDPAGDMPNVDIFAHYPISFNELWDTAEQMDLGGIICHVASVESLIKMKSIAGRQKDLEDIERLKDLDNEE